MLNFLNYCYLLGPGVFYTWDTKPTTTVNPCEVSDLITALTNVNFGLILPSSLQSAVW